jgi:hypothetical protein
VVKLPKESKGGHQESHHQAEGSEVKLEARGDKDGRRENRAHRRTDKRHGERREKRSGGEMGDRRKERRSGQKEGNSSSRRESEGASDSKVRRTHQRRHSVKGRDHGHRHGSGGSKKGSSTQGKVRSPRRNPQNERGNEPGFPMTTQPAREWPIPKKGEDTWDPIIGGHQEQLPQGFLGFQLKQYREPTVHYPHEEVILSDLEEDLEVATCDYKGETWFRSSGLSNPFSQDLPEGKGRDQEPPMTPQTPSKGEERLAEEPAPEGSMNREENRKQEEPEPRPGEQGPLSTSQGGDTAFCPPEKPEQGAGMEAETREADGHTPNPLGTLPLR